MMLKKQITRIGSTFTSLVFSFLVCSCSVWKNEMNKKGGKREVFMNSIIDFANTSSRELREDSVFVLTFKEVNGYLSADVYGYIGKFIVGTNGKSTVFPSECFEYNGKLFFWRDSVFTKPDSSVISILSKYNLIDSVKHTGVLNFYTDHSKLSTHYYYCKNNLLRYKKIKTLKALGYLRKKIRLKCK